MGDESTAAAEEGATTTEKAADGGSYPGQSIGLARTGPGSAAGFGRRLVALLIDCVLATLVALFFTRPHAPKLWSAAVLFVEYTFFVGLFGQTPGMRVLGIGCVDVSDGRPIGIPRAAVRAVLLQLFVPAVILDRNGRGWHDKAAASVMVRG